VFLKCLGLGVEESFVVVLQRSVECFFGNEEGFESRWELIATGSRDELG